MPYLYFSDVSIIDIEERWISLDLSFRVDESIYQSLDGNKLKDDMLKSEYKCRLNSNVFDDISLYEEFRPYVVKFSKSKREGNHIKVTINMKCFRENVY